MQALMQRNSYVIRDAGMIIGEGNGRYVLKVRDLPTDGRPREKLLAAGPGALSHAELMAVVFGVGTRKEEVLAMAHRVVREYGEQTIASEKDPVKLAEILAIPLIRACQVVASFELGRRAFLLKENKPVYIRTAQQAYQHLCAIGYLQKEQLRGLYLNSRFQVIHEEVISVGSLTASIVHPREVFRPAVEHGAVAVVVAHNHPSGSLEPTPDDIQATTQLMDASRALGIDLLDHLIIAGDSFRSCKEGE